MKATRANYVDMWEKYFDNYPGWLYVADCICPSQEHQESVKKVIVQEECNASCILSEPENASSDKFYSVDRDSYYLSDVPSESYSSNNEAKNPNVIINTTQNKGNENNSPSEGTEENNNHIEVAKETKTEKIIRCKPFIKQPDDIVFECDTGLGFAFVTQKDESLIYTPPKTCVAKTLGTIGIDTSCLKNPKTKILFSCNIYFKPRSGQGTSQLEFVLSRSCNNCTESPMGNWIYDMVNKSECVSQTFKFNFCSCNSFPGFYNYFIRVIPVYIKNCSILLTNCHIDAFAQSK